MSNRTITWPRVLLAAFIMLPIVLLPAGAQQSVSIIRGRLRATARRGDGSSYSAHLLELSTGAELAVTLVGADGLFTFRDVPPGTYQVDLYSGDERVASRSVDVSSTVPIDIVLGEAPGGEAEVLVRGARIAERMRTSTTTLFTAPRIESLPTIAPSKRIESILLNTPGVVPDEDGRLHVRGEDAQLQYIVDGIPITANMTRIYGSLFDARLVKSMSIQTGGFDAEYGVANAAVLDITTRSGFDAPFFVRASGSTGSFATHGGSLMLGGNIGGTASGFVAGSIGTSDRYLDPVASFEPLHDRGEDRHFFGKVDVGLGAVDIDAIGSVNRTVAQIPNRGIRGVMQNQELTLEDNLAGLRLSAELGDSSVASLVGYTRRGTFDLTSSGRKRIVVPEDSATAVRENERFFVGAERSLTTTGVQAEVAMRGSWLGLDHAAKVGAGYEVYPIDEFFTFAVTDPALAEPDTAGGDTRLRPFDITRGGRPFVVDTAATGNRISAFLQDRVVVDAWTVSAGVRFDRFELLEEEIAISPRVAVAYQTSPDLSLRFSYNYLVSQAPLENILASSSQEALLLAAGEQQGISNHVMSERAHALELGANWSAAPELTVGAVGHGKLIENFIVKAELGNSGIIFPINLKEGIVAGGELYASLRDWNAITATMTVSGGVALGMRPEDGSSPIAAGLIIGEEGENYSHPFSAEEVFPTEHSQLLAASLNARWDHSSGLFAILGARFDSGLPFDLTDASGNGLTPEQARVELQRRGYGDDVIDLLSLEMEEPGSPDKAVAPHATVDLGVGFDLHELTGVRARISGVVTNVLDAPYLYKFESSFGGTHFGVPRSFAVEASVEF
jgi:hypothetical protein